jgi:hypothetical protein
MLPENSLSDSAYFLFEKVAVLLHNAPDDPPNHPYLEHAGNEK